MKNKLKYLVAFLAIMVMFSANFVFADQEEAPDPSAMPISENGSEESLIAPAPEENSADIATKQETTLKQSDVYLTGDNVTIDYVVDGNVFIVGNKVTINSQIGGDAFIIANDLTLGENSYIFNSLFVSATTVNIKGVVSDVYAVSSNVNISGYVYRDIKVTSNSLSILGAVGRNVFFTGNSISFTDGSEAGLQGTVAGNLKYSSNNELTIPENAVRGTVDFSKIDSISPEATVGSIIATYLLKLGSFLGLLILIWLLILWLAPKFLNQTSNIIKQRSTSVVGFGLLGLIVVPIISMILLLLGITATASLLLLGLYAILLVASTSISVIAINNLICDKLKISKLVQKFGMLVASGIVVWAVCLIPYLGAFISFVLCVAGLGIIATHLISRNKSDKSQKESTNNKIEEPKKSKKEDK